MAELSENVMAVDKHFQKDIECSKWPSAEKIWSQNIPKS